MRDKDIFSDRARPIIAGVIIVASIFIFRLLYLQVISSQYSSFAGKNAFLNRTIFPQRGLMYDRKGELLVYNQPSYDVMIVMQEVQPFDTLDFCSIVGLTKEQFVNRIKQITNRRLNPGYSSYTPQVFMNQLSTQMYGVFQEKMYRFPGFYIQNRTLREYTYPFASHLIGNVGEVNQKDIEDDSYYNQGDYSGRSGVEKQYEEALRGVKGKEILLKDAHGRIKGSYNEGKHDVAPISGKSLTLTIDAALQQYGEQLMQNKLGSIVAIEPKTGEVLCLISAPTYDPRLLIGRARGTNYNHLARDPYKPLFERPIMAQYPPGSTFKTAQALVLQEEEIINPHTAYPCARGFYAGRLKVGCHPHSSPLQLAPSIQHSCNAYYCYGLRNMLENKKYGDISNAFEIWKDHMVSMGFGYKLGIDLPGEKRGMIPNSEFYNKIYRKGGWRALTIISISIGQGEILSTPLQICNLAASIANRGYFYTPHVVKKIEGQSQIDKKYRTRHDVTVHPQYYESVVEGMYLAVNGEGGGTAHGAKIPNALVCGKTGTAQNPHGKDHSIFMAFAPKDDPKIAIAVYVENAGFGATYAVPIASLMMEKYLNDTISTANKWKEENMMKAVILPGVQKINP